MNRREVHWNILPESVYGSRTNLPAIHSRFHGQREKEGSFVMELSLEIQREKGKNERVVCCDFFGFERVYVVKEFEFV